jgi:hypothetical protein
MANVAILPLKYPIILPYPFNEKKIVYPINN